jgi:hypothetical protein
LEDLQRSHHLPPLQQLVRRLQLMNAVQFQLPYGELDFECGYKQIAATAVTRHESDVQQKSANTAQKRADNKKRRRDLLNGLAAAGGRVAEEGAGGTRKGWRCE